MSYGGGIIEFENARYIYLFSTIYKYFILIPETFTIITWLIITET